MTRGAMQDAMSITRAAGTRGHVAKRRRGTGDEHANTLATDPTYAFGACIAFVQDRRASAARTIDLNILVS